MKRTLSDSLVVMTHVKGENDCIIELNVGGTILLTTRNTLEHSTQFFPNSLLGKMFSSSNNIDMLLYDKEGRIFIDSDPQTFLSILNLLRRPSTMGDIPSHMSLDAWCRELEYWGLAEREELDRDAKKVKPMEVMTMREISEKIKRDIANDEETVVKLILESTGYYSQIGKSRKPVLYIPIGHCKLPWGSDLGETLENDDSHYAELIQKLLALPSPVTIKKDIHKKQFSYQFQGETYTEPETKTMKISFSISSV